MTSLQLAQTVNINDFIQAAVMTGLVDRVIWLKPEWAFELNYAVGSNYSFYTAVTFGGGEGKQIGCTLCSSLVVENDLDAEFEVIYAEETTYTLLSNSFPPGEDYRTSTFLHHVFYFRTTVSASGPPDERQYIRYKVEDGLDEEVRVKLSSLPWVQEGHIVPHPDGTMRPLPHSEL